MSDMSWEHASEAREALNAIVSDPEHGVAALSNAQTMSNLLKDYLPDAPREKSILVAAAEAGLADTLREHVSQGMDPSTAIRLTASSFSSSTPFTPDACNWVTDEIAVALGISPGRSPGNPPFGGGGQFDNPPGYPSAAGQGQPTQVAGGGAPGYPSGQPSNLGGGTGYPQSPGAGYSGGPAGPQEQPTAQGYSPGYGPQQGGGYGGVGGVGGVGGAPTQAGGFGGQPGQPGQPVGGYPGQPAYPQPGGFGQPAGGYPGQAAQPGFGGAQTPAYGGQPGQPASPGGWTPGPYGAGQGGGFGGPQSTGGGGGRKGLFIGGGIGVAIVIVLILVFALGGGGKKHHAGGGGGHTPSVSHTPTTTPTPTQSTPPPSTGPEPLATIMNPAGFKPVGTECTTALLFGLDKSTIKTRTFCAKTTGKNIDVWGYQFFTKAGYKAGVDHINSYTGFSKSTDTCPPATDSEDGETGWHANSNPRYKARPGQNIECFLDNGKPVLIWTMPTQNVFFIAQYHVAGGTLTQIVDWWKTVNYG
jgi:hypothetical protein